MHAQIGDRTVLRRLDVDAREAVGGSLRLLGQFVLLLLRLAQLVRHVLLAVVLHAQNIDLGFGDRLPGLGDLRQRVAALAFHLGQVALQLQQTRPALEPLGHQLLGGGDLLLQQRDAPAQRRHLGLVTGDLLVYLVDALLDRGDFRLLQRAPRVENLLLAGERRRHGRLAMLGQEVRRKADFRGTVALGDEARFARPGVPELAAQRHQRRARLGVVEADQGLPRGHRVAIMDENGGDDTALEMLHRLAARLRDHRTGRDGGALQRRHRRPGAEADDEDADEG